MTQFRSVPALLRGLLLIVLMTSVGLAGSSASGQTSETSATENAKAEQAVPPKVEAKLETSVPTQTPNLSGLDLTDPDIQAALQAREAADRAIIEAVLKQKQSQSDARVEAVETPGSGPVLTPDAIKAKAEAAVQTVLGWMTSPKFLAQLGAIILAWFLAPIFAGQLRKRLFFFRDPPAEDSKIKVPLQYVYRSGNFLRAVILVALLAVFAVVLKALPAFGEDWLVKLAQSVAVVFLIYKAIKEFLTNDLFRKLATWTLIPLALIATFGYLDELQGWLNGTTVVPMGDTPITAMTLIRLAIFGSLFFWLGNLSNSRGQDAIRSQESLDVATREVVAKLFQMILFVILVVLVMSFAGIPLSGLVMIVSAVGLGIGLGLQPIAANFVSGLIILFDRSVRKGDFVVLPDGQEGFVDAINMRSTIVETTDGKDIMVPNTTFTDNTYENWTHKDPRQRYEVHFGVDYKTDIDTLEDIIIPVFKAHPSVLDDPEEPDLELREFGPYSIKFAVEFWASGIDDGPNKFTSDLNFLVWRTLKAHGIVMPLPQRVVHTPKGD